MWRSSELIMDGGGGDDSLRRKLVLLTSLHQGRLGDALAEATVLAATFPQDKVLQEMKE